MRRVQDMDMDEVTATVTETAVPAHTDYARSEAMTAMIASGMDRWEAFGLAYVDADPEGVVGPWLATMTEAAKEWEGSNVQGFTHAMMAVGKVNPQLADRLFFEAVKTGNVPKWMGSDGISWHETDWLTRLPDGIEARSLFLNRNVNLKSLPGGMRLVDGSLDMTGCVSWDGIIPEDAVIGFKVYTDLHPEGITLDEWRRLHPNGERS